MKGRWKLKIMSWGLRLFVRCAQRAVVFHIQSAWLPKLLNFQSELNHFFGFKTILPTAFLVQSTTKTNAAPSFLRAPVTPVELWLLWHRDELSVTVWLAFPDGFLQYRGIGHGLTASIVCWKGFSKFTLEQRREHELDFMRWLLQWFDFLVDVRAVGKQTHYYFWNSLIPCCTRLAATVAVAISAILPSIFFWSEVKFNQELKMH